jgi:hypothetical protein
MPWKPRMASMAVPGSETESVRAQATAVPPMLNRSIEAVRGPQRASDGRALDRSWGIGVWRWWKGMWLVAGLMGVLVLAHFPPEQHGFYPRCTLFTSTGLLCPGCGSFRALHALTQGDWVRALRSNALLTIGLPLLVLGWVARMWGRGRFGARLELTGWMGWMALSLILLFGLLRNLPGPFARWLVP